MERLFDKVRSSSLHGLYSHLNVAVAGNHDGWQIMAGTFQTIEQIYPAHSRQIRVDQKAALVSRAISCKKGFAIRIVLHTSTVFFQRAANRFPDLIVVIDNEDNRRCRCWFG